MCEDDLQYQIETAIPEPPAGWLDSSMRTSAVDVKQRPDTEVEAFDVTGVATVDLADNTSISVYWTCFTQTVDGKTYAGSPRVSLKLNPGS